MIRIIYLHYPVAGRDSSDKKRPEWFDFEDCFKNLLHTLSLTSIPWSIDILMDGEKSENWISKYLRFDKVMLHEYPPCGGSLQIQRIFDFISASKWSSRDTIYILENDYIHKPGWPEHLVSAINTFGTDKYYTLYDHPFSTLKVIRTLQSGLAGFRLLSLENSKYMLQLRCIKVPS